MIWLKLVEMSQKNRKVKKMKTLRKKNRRNDIDVNEFVGLSADVNLRSLASSKGSFDLFFTDQV